MHAPALQLGVRQEYLVTICRSCSSVFCKSFKVSVHLTGAYLVKGLRSQGRHILWYLFTAHCRIETYLNYYSIVYCRFGRNRGYSLAIYRRMGYDWDFLLMIYRNEIGRHQNIYWQFTKQWDEIRIFNLQFIVESDRIKIWRESIYLDWFKGCIGV